ncbi:hypothetical protein FOA52_004694 [Chlamydomonas sp. UWO 241]|nr:hypothetical protein FOA52_004694 [Chlamydomonas sp. UWO 241]
MGSLRRESLGAVGGRPSSSDPTSGRSEESIKALTHRFDVEIVFKLSLAHKGLTTIACLERCINLVELDLSANTITKVEGLSTLVSLRRLDLSTNRITAVDGLSELRKLETLKLQGNLIASLRDVNLPQLAGLPCLKALYLQDFGRAGQNPVCRKDGYKSSVLASLANLSNLDGERKPHSSSYAEVAAEVDALIKTPVPREKVVLPDVAPWLPGAAGPSGTDGGDAKRELVDPEVQAKVKAATRAIDDCHALHELLKGEVAKAQRSSMLNAGGM